MTALQHCLKISPRNDEIIKAMAERLCSLQPHLHAIKFFIFREL
ncbi:hypothetical protein [Beijerinckia mobilis]|nr:hypothetical protein [Beijerinckia mobilis]